MYPAADIDELEAQIEFVDSLVRFIRMAATTRQPLGRIVASREQIVQERVLADLKADRERRLAPDLAMAAEASNGAEVRL